MKSNIKKSGILALFVALATVVFAPLASAHVTVKPAEVIPAGYVTFTVSVPNERSLSTTAVRLLVPDGLQYVTPSVKSGWTITTATNNTEQVDGHNDVGVKEILWTGGDIPQGQRDDFTFSAKVPAEATELTWKAYQTYADGTIVAWDKSDDDQSKKADGSPDFSNSGPFSVTAVKEAAEADTAVVESNDKTAERALYVAIAAAVVALLSLVLATRPQSKK